MGTNKIANTLFRKYPNVIERGATRLPLRSGDLVADAGYVNSSRMLDEGVGRIKFISGKDAMVEWRDGDVSAAPIKSLMRIRDDYEPMLHESAYDLPKFKPGTMVVLGNGDRGRVLEEVTGPTGFKSFRVEITGSVNTRSVGRRVFATCNGMLKVSGLMPDIIASAYKDGSLEPVAVVGCDLASDMKDQIVGLQKYSSIPYDHGMLFTYEPPRYVTFHMGKVSFPIDVMFIDSHGRIAAIEDSREPGCDERWNHGRVSAVLEVNGGYCTSNNILVGDIIRVRATRTAQEKFDPRRPDVENRGLTDIRPDAPDRFKGHGLPDDVLHLNDNSLKNWDQSDGYDVMKYHDDPDAPAFRPSANKK